MTQGDIVIDWMNKNPGWYTSRELWGKLGQRMGWSYTQTRQAIWNTIQHRPNSLQKRVKHARRTKKTHKEDWIKYTGPIYEYRRAILDTE